MSALITPALGGADAPASFAGSTWQRAASAAQTFTPYLRRLMERREDLIAAPDDDLPERLIASAVAAATSVAANPPPMEEAMTILRRAKDAAHLACALADLAQTWPLARVTGALTDFADAALNAAVALAAQEMKSRGVFEPAPYDAPTGPIRGLAIIAMGKMGAHELNYSSDIDVSIFYDIAGLEGIQAREPRVAAVKLVAPLVRALQEITADGYVFRTDLRLRPDPGSTPVAVSLAAAAHYYQSLGQNWERAAFIKARAAGGDIACGQDFLAELQPFIWRRHLDFAAVADVKSIKRQILSAHKSAELGDAVFDLKLGRGGIRDIELFAQTQQLILGGRDKTLRAQGTLAALDALASVGAVDAGDRDALHRAYEFFRHVEHRIQMLEDAQTHRVPSDVDARERLAALCGYESRELFERALIEQRSVVADIDHKLFGEDTKSLADPLGSLIFTGVEDHPDTLATVERLGFKNPAFVSQTIRGWHHGRIRAMRAERARELLTDLTPRLLRAFASAGDPDQAFARFNVFFSSLSAGVQVLALLDARPSLLDLLARLFALAPRLATALAQRPALMDVMIEPHFAQPLANDAPGARGADLLARVRDVDGFEAKLNVARRFQREEAFRIAVQVLEGVASAENAGAAHADLAEACVVVMAEAALAEAERTQGNAPGAYAVLALGKFGGRELTESSDLDIMVVFDEPERTEFYAKFTQRLISALSAPTEEGILYEVDFQLRPSGSKGPVAVRFAAFEHYYEQEAWTWELLALTRVRPVAGDAELGARTTRTAHHALARTRDDAKLRADVADMRLRMERERPGKSVWDLKLAPGGLVDIEFAAQTLQLLHGAAHPEILSPNTGEALQRAAAAKLIAPEQAARLVEAWTLWSDLQQTLRVCVEGQFEPEAASSGLQARLAAAGGAADFAALEQKIATLQHGVRAIYQSIVTG